MAVATSSSAAEGWLARLRQRWRGASLRLRVAVAASTALLLLIVAQTVVLLSMYEEMEQDFIDELLDEQIAYSIAAARIRPELALPNTPTMKLFRLHPGAALPADLPLPHANLPIGNHEVFEPEREYHLAVREADGLRYILRYEEGAHGERERAMAVAVIGSALAMFLLAFVLVLASVDRLTRGLERLAQRVVQGAETPPDGRLHLQPGMEPELATVAHALDVAAARQAQLLARERDFSSHLAHELRTPLAGIRSDAELIVAVEALPAAAQRRAQRIVATSDRITVLAESLLLLARDARPQLTETLDLRLAIRDVWAELGKARLRTAADVAELELAVPDAVLLQADPTLLRLVLRNLLENALRHGGGRGLRCELQGTKLAVLDRGPGFGALDPQQAFERFHGAGRNAGSGLGLALVRHVCAACGWSVAARNRAVDEGVEVAGEGGACVEVDFGDSLGAAASNLEASRSA